MDTHQLASANAHSENDFLKEQFRNILEAKLIHSVYQPIISLKDGTVFGYEALTRGPENSPFHSPMKLFPFAEEEGFLYTLEKLAREMAIKGAFFSRNNEMLFINISAAILQDPHFAPGKTLELLQARGLQPGNIVFEITERSSIEDFTTTKRILDHYRNQGYRIAIDDAGAGYSSLQAIAELQPDFIKIDRSLVHHIHLHKNKEYIVETFVSFADKLNISLIAEGIESQEELQLLTRMGIHYVQGFLLGKPATEIAVIDPKWVELIVQHRKIRETGGGTLTIGDVISPIQIFDSKALISEVANFFKSNVKAQGAVIVSNDEPVGLMMRERLFQKLAGQYGFSLFWNRSIDQMMDPKPLIVDKDTPIETVSQLATSRDTNLYDFVIITNQGKMAGASSIRAILECITNTRMENAKVASPLTGLPGNIQIQRELTRRLMEKKPFAVLYADLDYFKWFNDRYGFQKGDQLIQFTADVLQHAIVLCGKPLDFVGHIGGDDFIMITSTDEPDRMCKEIIRRFDQSVPLFYEGDDWTYVEDRKGNRIETSGVTISLSLIVCETETPITLEEISQSAATLKKLSKASIGSVYCSTYLGLADLTEVEPGKADMESYLLE
ncbi:GGDEF domain-containing protein [Paenibacillus sp. WQ 127069]|uniref:GGDEF domain-containing protein n=1 Tax=Paenibacillus baimaensis TaxID=2982185 RepID=A0ABT2UL52_9BACL|nr:GGDEF domain-containing protein [Paenibacillus sp. WQ 127069]MCU6794607.1 GGDEF domain-containing protein [Paenibacillus sp. WQ 127069]